MNFAYGPPPPPPPKKQERGNSENRKNIQLKNETRVGPEDSSNSEIQDMGVLGDLPTHLPNSAEAHSVGDSKEEFSEDEEMILKKQYQETRTKPKEPVFIPGTSITLETEEDINKWIEERKKKWPSRRNIEEKEKLRQTQETGTPKKRQNESTGNQNTKKPKNICKFYQNNKRCKFGNKCKNVHELASTGVNKPSQNVKTINNIPVAIPQRFKNEMYINEKDSGAHPLLFKMLVQKDHFENENSKVLEFIQFLNEKGLIDHNVTI